VRRHVEEGERVERDALDLLDRRLVDAVELDVLDGLDGALELALLVERGRAVELRLDAVERHVLEEGAAGVGSSASASPPSPA